MARQKNSVETAQITISTTPMIRDYLEQLTAGGLYGKSPAEAAERLISERIKQLIKEEELNRIPFGAGSGS